MNSAYDYTNWLEFLSSFAARMSVIWACQGKLVTCIWNVYHCLSFRRRSGDEEKLLTSEWMETETNGISDCCWRKIILITNKWERDERDDCKIGRKALFNSFFGWLQILPPKIRVLVYPILLILPNSLKWTQCSSNTITAIFEFENAGTIYTFVYCSMSISELPDIPHDRAWIQSQMPHKEKEWEVIIIEIFATTFFNKNLNPIVKVGGTYIINFTIHLTIMPRGGMLWCNWNLNS